MCLHQLFIDLHRYGIDPRFNKLFYPGTGAANEIGVGAGLGFTVNVPLAAGAGEAEYLAAFDDIVMPRLTQFNPVCASKQIV